MLPKWHFLFGAIFSILMYFVFSATLFQTALVFLSSVLIDFDHYLHYVQKKKNLSLKKAYNWNKKLLGKNYTIMHIFHTAEIMVLIAILSLFWNFFLFVLIGMLFHSIFDEAELIHQKRAYVRELSFFRFLFSNKKKYF